MSVVLSLILAVTALGAPVSVSPITGRLIDGYGREVTFHGPNYVVKGAPYLPTREELTANLEKMQEMGLNAMRLGAMWPGLQPTRDQRSATFLQSLVDIVRLAASYGVHSLIDMHQDLYSERFCGDGMPLWTIVGNASSFPWPLAEPFNVSGPYPSWQDCARFPWATFYFTAAVNEAFGAFYNNTNGILDEWVETWRQISTAMADLDDAVLGYELLNEPWPGNVFQDPSLILPALADRALLQAAWDKAAVAIRSVDASHAIFFEGITWDWLGEGFAHPPGGSAEATKSVISYHFYSPPEITPAQTIDGSMKTAAALRCGSMLTEFFYSLDVIELCESRHQSWLMWAVEGFGSSMTSRGRAGMKDPIVPASMLSRTYAPIVAGTAKLSHFDNHTHTYLLIYETNSTRVSNATSVLYLNEAMHYPLGFKVRWLASQGDLTSVTWSHPCRNTLVFTHDEKVLSNAIITIEIFANSSGKQR